MYYIKDKTNIKIELCTTKTNKNLQVRLGFVRVTFVSLRKNHNHAASPTQSLAFASLMHGQQVLRWMTDKDKHDVVPVETNEQK
jgi:hypothetical protein